MELLLLLCALFAFLLALLPLIAEARQTISFAAIVKQEQIVFDRLAADCKNVFLLGGGNVVRRKQFFPADRTTLAFSEEKSEFWLTVEHEENSLTISKKLAFPVELNAGGISQGVHDVVVENQDGTVRVSIT